jgi:ABC-type transporter Mla subunit MlaD
LKNHGLAGATRPALLIQIQINTKEHHTMKLQNILPIWLASGLLLSLTACSKEEVKDTSTKAVDATKNAADKAATAVKDTTEKAVDATRDAATTTSEAVKDAAATKDQTAAAKSAGNAASADIATVLANARKLVSEGKWQEAAKAIEPLGSLKLTPEQQSLLDQFKKQIAQLQTSGQKLTDDANKAVGDLLKK